MIWKYNDMEIHFLFLWIERILNRLKLYFTMWRLILCKCIRGLHLSIRTNPRSTNGQGHHYCSFMGFWRSWFLTCTKWQNVMFNFFLPKSCFQQRKMACSHKHTCSNNFTCLDEGPGLVWSLYVQQDRERNNMLKVSTTKHIYLIYREQSDM